MGRLIRVLATCLVLALVGAGGYAWMQGREDGTSPYEIVKVERGDILEKAVAIGQIEPRVEFQVKSKIAGIVHSFHGKPVAVPVLAGEVADAAGAVGACEERRTDRTVALYLSTPNNPSGRLLPRSWVESLVAWAARHDLWVITDEAYDAFVYAGEHVRALPLAPERTFLAQTFSKR